MIAATIGTIVHGGAGGGVGGESGGALTPSPGPDGRAGGVQSAALGRRGL